MWLKNATILDGLFHFTPGDIRITGAYIDRVCSRGRYASEPAETLDCTGRYIIPGLIDIHTHGCNGSDASDGTPQALDNISGFLARNGITSFLPTTTTLTDELLLKALREIAAFMQRGVPGAYAHGANMEGPYLSHEKRGAHRDDWLQLPRMLHFMRMNNACGNIIKIVSVAPELDGALEFIKVAQEQAIVSLAHSAATYDTAMEAIARGATHVTHLFNAMSGLGHREPGLVGAIADSNVDAELICDCVHIHPAVLRATFKMLGYERVIMISDSMSATGLPDGDYTLGGLSVFVRDGSARLEDGTLAGSTTTLMGDVRRAYAIGVPLEKAVKAATLNPAVSIGVDGVTGSIDEGKLADLVILDEQLEVERVFIRGEPAYDKFAEASV